MNEPCTFCSHLAGRGLLAENGLAAGLYADYPVSPGHALIVPRRHEADFFALDHAEQAAIWALVDDVRDRIERDFHPGAYNLGLNAGVAAGQTIMHAHVHVIPRYAGDVEDPRGGVRWVIPARAKYW